MERGKQSGSSFTSDLFGAKDPAASSAGIFSSIFAPPARVKGGVSLHVSETEKKNDSASRQAGNAKSIVSGGEEEKVEPCHYSSSIYYGGQDFYSQPAQSTAELTTFCKDVGEDDSAGTASRGNWWQGSLYY